MKATEENKSFKKENLISGWGQYQITQIKKMRAEKAVGLGPEFINVL